MATRTTASLFANAASVTQASDLSPVYYAESSDSGNAATKGLTFLDSALGWPAAALNQTVIVGEDTTIGTTDVLAGQTYRCIADISVAGTDADWVLFAESAGASNVSFEAWGAITAYKAGDIVVTASGANVKRTADGTSTAQFDATEAADWVYLSNNGKRPLWVADTFYFAGQKVENPDREVFYICNTDHQSDALDFNDVGAVEAAQWDYDGQDGYPSHSSDKSYAKGEIVSYGSNYVYAKNVAGHDLVSVGEADGWSFLYGPSTRELDIMFAGVTGSADSGDGYYQHSSNSAESYEAGVVLHSDSITESARFTKYLHHCPTQTGDQYQVRATFAIYGVSASEHVIKLGFVNSAGTVETSSLINIGATQEVIETNDVGDITGSASMSIDQRNDDAIITIDMIKTQTADSTDPFYFFIEPVFNQDGTNVEDLTATGGANLSNIEKGLPSKFLSSGGGLAQNGVLPVTVLEQGIYTADGTNASSELPASSGSQSRVMVTSNAAGVGTVITVPAGESLNGSVDGSYTTQSDGEMVLFLDNGVGEWTAQVIGASQQTDLNTLSITMDSFGSALSTLSVNGGYDVVQLDTASLNTLSKGGGLIVTGNTVVVGKTGTYYLSLSTSSNTTNAAFAIYKNGATLISGNTSTDFTNRNTVDGIVGLTEGDVLEFGATGTLGGGFYTPSIIVNELPSTTSVLAGMVVPTDLSQLQAFLSANQLAVAADAVNWDDIDFNKGSKIELNTTNGQVTLQKGSYTLSATLSPSSSSGFSFSWYDVTNSSLVGSPTTANSGGLGKGSATNNHDVNVETETVFELRFINVSGSISAYASSSDWGGASLRVRELPTSTVVNPEGLVPEDLHFYGTSSSTGGTTASSATFKFSDAALDVKNDAHGLLVGDTLVIQNSGSYKIDFSYYNTSSNPVGDRVIKVNGNPVSATFANTSMVLSLRWAGDLNAGDVITIDYNGAAFAWRGGSFTLQQISTKTVLVQPTTDAYSETEILTGRKWIDGKDVYEKVCVFSSMGNNGLLVAGVDTIIGAEGGTTNTNIGGGPYQFPLSISSVETTVTKSGSNAVLYVASGSSTGHVTLRYTKV